MYLQCLTALVHLFPSVHNRGLFMKHQKTFLRIESICEAIVYIWMIFYVKQEIFSFPYPNWLTPLVLITSDCPLVLPMENKGNDSFTKSILGSFKYRLCSYACGCCDWHLLQTCKYSIWNNLSCYIYAG